MNENTEMRAQSIAGRDESRLTQGSVGRRAGTANEGPKQPLGVGCTPPQRCRELKPLGRHECRKGLREAHPEGPGITAHPREKGQALASKKQALKTGGAGASARRRHPSTRTGGQGAPRCAMQPGQCRLHTGLAAGPRSGRQHVAERRPHAARVRGEVLAGVGCRLGAPQPDEHAVHVL